MASLRDRYNRFLDANPLLTAFGSLQDEIREHQKGHRIQLIGTIVLGGFITLFLSLLASILGYGNPGASLLYMLLFTLASMLVNNIVFGVFLLRVREQSLTMDIIKQYGRLIVVQILCTIVLSLAQTLVINLLATLLSFDARVSILVQICISLVFTLLNAIVAFRVLDGVHRVRDIMPGMFSVLSRHAVPLAFLGILFLAWSFVSNVYYATILYTQITTVQSINNVLHALLSQHEFLLFGKVILFYLVNYVVGGFFETSLLLGTAVCYEREKDRVF